MEYYLIFGSNFYLIFIPKIVKSEWLYFIYSNLKIILNFFPLTIIMSCFKITIFFITTLS